MNYWIRCNNCGKVGKYHYPSDIAGDEEANRIVNEESASDGWIGFETYNFCSDECKEEFIEHKERTGVEINLPAAWRFQQRLKGESDVI